VGELANERGYRYADGGFRQDPSIVVWLIAEISNVSAVCLMQARG
jgi:hypothetical protein